MEVKNNTPKEITRMMQQVVSGNRTVVNQLLPLVYDELRACAQKKLYGEKAGHTINPTALVHESYLKLVQQEGLEINHRTHFFAIAAQAMRRILIDYARAQKSQKRGGENQKVTLVDDQMVQELPSDDLIALNESLDRLQKLNKRQSRVVEYWFFGGLKHEEIAEILGVSLPSIRRDWRLARAWLSRELKQTSLCLS